MRTVSNILIALVALLHTGFLMLEMFFWNHPIGHKIFNLTPEVAESSAVLAMNQGLYNGFLAAGLFWGLISDRRHVKFFFLTCIVVAGIFGGITVKPGIFVVQALPAFLAAILLWLSPGRR